MLNFIGTLSKLHPTFLGMTILAMGNTTGDVIANVALARYGMGITGFTACFGGPLFNLLIGIGGSFFRASLERGSFEFDIFKFSGGGVNEGGGFIIVGVLTVVILILVMNIVFASLMDYRLKGIYSKIMVGVYFFVILLASIYSILVK